KVWKQNRSCRWDSVDVGYRQRGEQKLAAFISQPAQCDDCNGDGRDKGEGAAQRRTAVEGRLIEECRSLSVGGDRGAAVSEVAVWPSKKERDCGRLIIRIGDCQTGVDRTIHLRVDPARLK